MKLVLKFGPAELEVEGEQPEVDAERDIFLRQLANHDPYSTENKAPSTKRRQDDISTCAANLSLNNIIKSKQGIKNDTDIVMATAYYLYKIQGLAEFTSKDIDNAIMSARLRKIGNTSQSITQNIKKGFLSQLNHPGEGGLKLYQVLVAGEDWYEQLPAQATSPK